MRTLATKQPGNDFAKQKKNGDKVRSRSVSPLSTGMPLLQHQCACGGGCPRCQEKLGIQTKLKISEPGDKYEQEADRIADEVMRMPEPRQRETQPKSSLGISSSSIVQRQVEGETQQEQLSRPSPFCRQEGDRCIDRGCSQFGRVCEPIEPGTMKGCRCLPTSLPTSQASILQRHGTKSPAEHLLLQRACSGCSREVKPEETEPISIMTKGLDGGSCDSVPDDESMMGQEDDEELATTAMAKPATGSFNRSAHSLERLLSHSRGGGNPLSGTVRSFMESRFGRDLSVVRIHTDRYAVRMAKALNAEAFASGRDVYFGEGRYSPSTTTGKRLLAHELTHTIQQSGNWSTGQEETVHPYIQRFTLKGFPPTEEAAMNAAVPAAIAKVKACSQLSWYGKSEIPKALNFVRYDYVPDLGLCGWTFPSSWYIKIGQQAFDTSRCCDLPSTLAHEASHTVWYTEGKARKMECNCFGCSC
ncbi:MAG TPA: hypothetical protein DDZ80_08865 [Cyanobacteria bacterium UBA8803]|nr:hypothetical protein [Cyanobacteria bacterium UBA9273]HBL58610.1 hypothetical protein [Cyanobacteria bacterium UBA8803]